MRHHIDFRLVFIGLICVLCTITARRYLSAQEGTTFTLISRTGNEFQLEAQDVCAPGTVVRFEVESKSIYLRVYRRLAERRYSATTLSAVSEASDSQLRAGMVGTTSTLQKNWLKQGQDHSSIEYWAELKNPFLFGSSEFLVLANGKDLRDGKLPSGLMFLLELREPPIDGYVSLLSIDTQKYTVTIFYPNSQSKPDVFVTKDTSELNLTYSAKKIGEPIKPALLGIGLRASPPGPNQFVVVISRDRRPLSDFLPPGHSARYLDFEGRPVEPWQVGPGYLNRSAQQKEFTGVEYLAGDAWAISNLSVETAP